MLLTLRSACLFQPELVLRSLLVERDLRVDAQPVQYTSLTGRQVQRKVIPDAYVQIERRAGESKPFPSRLLLEIDLSTHPNRRFAENKVLAGLAWLKSGQYRRRFGASRGRWLVVTKSQQRLEHLRETTQRAAGKEALLWYFTTFDQITSQTLLTEPIWSRASDTAPVALFPPRT